MGYIDNTLINTYRGFKRIDDLSIGDLVLNENNQFVPIIDIKKSEAVSILKLRGMCFDEINCSEN